MVCEPTTSATGNPDAERFADVPSPAASSFANIERQLLTAHAASVVSLLTGGVAHHFNNLLSGMLGLVTLAPNLDRDSLLDLSERLRAKIEHASRLTQVLLDITRRANQEEANATCELVSRTREAVILAEASGGPGVHFETHLPEGEMWAQISPLTYTRALLNLLVTPIEPPGQTEDARFEVSLARRGDSCVLSVESSLAAPAPRRDPRIVEAMLAGERVDPSLLSRAAVRFALREAGGSATFQDGPGGSRCVVRMTVVPGL